MTLVMVAVMPALAVAGLAFGTLAGRLTTQAGDAYGKANSIVQQVSQYSRLHRHAPMTTYRDADECKGVLLALVSRQMYDDSLVPDATLIKIRA